MAMKPFLLLSASLFLAACTTAPKPVAPDLTASVASTRQAIVKAQSSAQALRPHDAATLAAVADLREQLAAVGASFDATSGKVQWYEVDWKRLDGENRDLKGALAKRDATIASQAAALHQTAKERDFYPLMIAAAAALLCGMAFGPWALKLPGVLGFVAPLAVVLGGGIFGFTASRMLAAYGSRLIP